MKNNTKKWVQTALFLAIGMVLPMFIGQVRFLGQAISPMHIPVYLCGMIVGAPYGALMGFILPLLRSVMFGMPPMIPGGAAMAFEMCTYGLVSGLLYDRLKNKKIAGIYLSLIPAMIAGRIVWGIARAVIAGATKSQFTYAMFISGALTTALPGIIIHLIVVPAILAALEKYGGTD